MITSLNSELAKLTDGLKANKLSINVSKTHYMVFHRSRRKLDKEDIILDNTIIKQVNFTKFLLFVCVQFISLIKIHVDQNIYSVDQSLFSDLNC